MKISYIILFLALSTYTTSATTTQDVNMNEACEVMVVSPQGTTSTVKVSANGTGSRVSAGKDGFVAFAVLTPKCECSVKAFNKVQEKGVPGSTTIHTSRLPKRLGKSHRIPFVAAHLNFGCDYY